MDLLENIKILLGIDDNQRDALLNILIQQAKNEALDFCHLEEYTEALDNVVIKMTIQLYNKRGNEGLESVSYSGVSETYSVDYTTDVIRQLQRHRRLVAV